MERSMDGGDGTKEKKTEEEWRGREPEIQGREIKEGCGLRERGGRESRTSIGSRVAMPAQEVLLLVCTPAALLP